MMQKRNKPITISIDTGGHEIRRSSLLIALAPSASKAPFAGHIRYVVGRHGLAVTATKSKGKST